MFGRFSAGVVGAGIGPHVVGGVVTAAGSG